MTDITIASGSTRLETSDADLARLLLDHLPELAQVGSAPQPTTLGCAPAIGQLWPEQGGIYAGLMRGRDGARDYHLILAPSDHAAENLAWGAYGEAEPDAEHPQDGLANTIALVLSEHAHPAAEWAHGLALNGHSDWYLPARAELALCWLNVPEAFGTGWHWSSTQFSPIDAWVQGFAVGSQYGGLKDLEYRARAVRRFFTTSPL